MTGYCLQGFESPVVREFRAGIAPRFPTLAHALEFYRCREAATCTADDARAAADEPAARCSSRDTGPGGD